MLGLHHYNFLGVIWRSGGCVVGIDKPISWKNVRFESLQPPTRHHNFWGVFGGVANLL